jgi:hypothetical protein
VFYGFTHFTELIDEVRILAGNQAGLNPVVQVCTGIEDLAWHD